MRHFGLWAITVLIIAVSEPSAAVPTAATAVTTTITTSLTNFTTDNSQATRFDVDGNAVDAHDGNLAQFGDSYYLYGTSYDCGYQWLQNDDFCGFKAYSSTDLRHWTDRGFVVSARSCLACFRPHVVFDANTGKYVLWINDSMATDRFRVYTADSPVGPFTEAPVPDLPAGTSCTADLTVFVDRDGTAYLSCSNIAWHIAVIQLTPDYLRATGRYTVLGVTNVEAPAMFERAGRYYLTMSSACGYCTGSPTTYVTAGGPLGPWHGRQPWSVSAGWLRVRGGNYGLSKAGADWADYTFSADVIPRAKAHSTLTQAGWAVRMSAPDVGYLYLLTGTPTSNGTLSVLVRRHGTVRKHLVRLGYRVLAGVRHHVSVTARGSTFTTSIDGRRVDVFTDATYARGGVGFREYDGYAQEAADFDRAVVVGAKTLLSDAFTSTALASWIPPLFGTVISTNSCGGQASWVANLARPDGSSVYLYGSDLWNSHINEGLANYYWAPLQFAAGGNPLTLACTNFTLSIAGSDSADNPPADADQNAGAGPFTSYQAVVTGRRFGQSFIAGRTGILSVLSLPTYVDGTEQGRALRHPPTAPLSVQLDQLAGDGLPGPLLWSTDVQPASLGWSARELTLRPHIGVEAGERLAVMLSTTSPVGYFGCEIDRAGGYAAGTALQGGSTLTVVANTDMKFRTSVEPAA